VEDVVEGEDEGVEEELAVEGVSSKNHMIWIYLWGWICTRAHEPGTNKPAGVPKCKERYY
jgi:hypothetical protein